MSRHNRNPFSVLEEECGPDHDSTNNIKKKALKKLREIQKLEEKAKTETLNTEENEKVSMKPYWTMFLPKTAETSKDKVPSTKSKKSLKKNDDKKKKRERDEAKQRERNERKQEYDNIYAQYAKRKQDERKQEQKDGKKQANTRVSPELLQLQHEFTDELQTCRNIAQVRRKLSKKYHPDRNVTKDTTHLQQYLNTLCEQYTLYE